MIHGSAIGDCTSSLPLKLLPNDLNRLPILNTHKPPSAV